MRTVKRTILIILLLMLFAGGFLLDPLVRFALDLRLDRFNDAEAVYQARLCVTEPLQKEAQAQLTEFLSSHLDRYLSRAESYDRITGILSALSHAQIPQGSVTNCLEAVEQTEAARTDLMQADDLFERGSYAQAIPLYRRSLTAADDAAFRLEQAQIGYKGQVLREAETAMDQGQYAMAEDLLLKALEVLGTDGDLYAALCDAQQLAEKRTYDEISSKAWELLRDEGPEAAFPYVSELRQQAPNDYALDHLEQLLRHEYQEKLCEAALSLQDTGDLVGAYALLEDGLLWIDSQRIQTLHAEIGAAIPWLLGELPVLRDETGPGQSSAKSTIARDRYRMDTLSNEYQHSFSADMGQVTFSLQKAYALFTGTVAFPQGETTDIYRTSTSLQVYGDGKLIAEFKHMDSSAAPLAFSIPVTEVDELTLRWASEGANGRKDWGRFATIFDGRLFRSAAVKEAP